MLTINLSKSGFMTDVNGKTVLEPIEKALYCYGTKQKLSFSLEQYTTVFQADYAI
jgi:hypothetical protein